MAVTSRIRRGAKRCQCLGRCDVDVTSETLRVLKFLAQQDGRRILRLPVIFNPTLSPASVGLFESHVGNSNRTLRESLVQNERYGLNARHCFINTIALHFCIIFYGSTILDTENSKQSYFIEQWHAACPYSFKQTYLHLR